MYHSPFRRLTIFPPNRIECFRLKALKFFLGTGVGNNLVLLLKLDDQSLHIYMYKFSFLYLLYIVLLTV